MLGPTYFSSSILADAIIYVVDSMDRDRIGISKTELLTMLEEDELKKAILVVFANKQDLEGCLSVTEVANALGLATLKNRKYQIFKTSATKGEGLDEAMEWLSNAILQQKWILVKRFVKGEGGREGHEGDVGGFGWGWRTIDEAKHRFRAEE